jgi:hypothetical protein
MIPTILQTWVRDCLVRIGETLDLGGKDASTDRSDSDSNIDPLSLAIAFVCCPRKCGAAGHIPTLLKHSCKGPSYGLGNDHWLHVLSYGLGNDDAYEAVAERVFYGQMRFTPGRLDFGSKRSAVEGVVRAYGRNPKTTTIHDMADERRLVSCGTCVRKAKDPRQGSKPDITPNPMDWLAAVGCHFLQFSLKPHETAVIDASFGEIPSN